MSSRYTTAQLIACRSLAMEQNKKMFADANALSRAAFDVLDHPDFDSDQFHYYLHLRGKAEALFREALDHFTLLNEHFPPLPAQALLDPAD
ncbi:hypothetical protein [Pseudomonas sp. PD9R]|uniref:hypothetical protein n=1 Tax=Pseudomonas sp. PD9R TaxID=2853534 RepID=UPI001C4441C9|nr:hypothetical protein [Pseudomonas sp. PD9R]MBV6822096.1 hypothetical protein [Pseudomonas sp. PD9R]